MTAVASQWVTQTDKSEYEARLFVQRGDTEVGAHDLIYNALDALADAVFAQWLVHREDTNVTVKITTQGAWESTPVQFNREAMR